VRRRFPVLLVALLVVATLGFASGEAAEPRVSAESYVVLDAASGRVLLAKNAFDRRPIASLTKMMTALLTVERGDLVRKIRIPKVATRVEPNRDGLRAGRWYSRRLLLYSAMLESNNDAAAALGYDIGDGSLARFYATMNARARDLGLFGTTYRSASGLNDETNLSTAYDQAQLSLFAMENREFARVAGTRSIVFAWPPPTHSKEYLNHNRMLFSYPGTFGVKTGYTSRAGGCLAVAVRKNGHAIVAVALGSDNIWKDMPKLVNRAFAAL
jgi:D-alanyl-D-alanine carboxypeptidase/D-alanyl-D-alanine carboxypeptidase (penicillin-binding protein 5/6)